MTFRMLPSSIAQLGLSFLHSLYLGLNKCLYAFPEGYCLCVKLGTVKTL